MRLNSIQQSTSFGKLYIDNKAENYMMNASDKDLEALTKAKEDLDSAEHCHLVVGENGNRIVETPHANKYFGGSFELDGSEPNDRFLPFNATWAGIESGKLHYGDLYKGTIMFINANAARNAYHDIKQAPLGSIERDVKITKYLNDEVILKKAQAEQDFFDQTQRQKMARQLMDDCRRPDLEA